MSRPKEIDYGRLESRAFQLALKGLKVASTSRVNQLLREVSMQDASLRQQLFVNQTGLNGDPNPRNN